MDAGAIQDFLNLRGAGCTVGTDGSPCLKNYRMNTTDRAADALCGGYRGAYDETAAQVIARVAATCRVNPRVLLVLLQKEMGLVTATNPTAKKYERAAGYACPDTANGGCDPTYAGLQNQLYRSAWQYQRYASSPASYQYKAGRNNIIQWHPNSGCGTSTVYIANQATAGLYIYTPYRPNQAALNAGYGTGDSCSSYGNRNFWNYFTDWFGSTQSAEGSALYAKYQSLGGNGGALGSVQSPYLCGLANNGCFQVFSKGLIYWTPSTGAWAVTGAILDRYTGLGREYGTLGYPLSDANCGLAGSGCYQVFERGTVYWTAATGAYAVYGLVGAKWVSTGAENGALGYPTGDPFCGIKDAGCFQPFQRGLVYWTAATGAHTVSGDIATKWGAIGRENGALGYPTMDRACGLVAGGCYQIFQFGTIYTAPDAGTHVAKGGIGYTWMGKGAENGPLGYPVGDEVCGLVGGGCSQDFQRGSVYWSGATNAYTVQGLTRAKHDSVGRERGVLGYPTMEKSCALVRGGCYQVFQYGTVYESPAGTFIAKGGLGHTWMLLGAENGSMGYPTSDEYCGLRENGCFQLFEHGSVYYAPAFGAFPVDGPIRDAWIYQGAENGWWGYPTGKPQGVPGGATQRFERGTATWTSGTGAVTFG
ncbi:hypothetical protein JKP76_08275 [Blastococcus sp. TML/C7B]|nr:hypothetical protein [Blastococcus sp. TML/C7B]MBN1096023.1 hypothetical protein [Blastococcus sp. TML/C7B]